MGLLTACERRTARGGQVCQSILEKDRHIPYYLCRQRLVLPSPTPKWRRDKSQDLDPISIRLVQDASTMSNISTVRRQSNCHQTKCLASCRDTLNTPTSTPAPASLFPRIFKPTLRRNRMGPWTQEICRKRTGRHPNESGNRKHHTNWSPLVTSRL